MRRITQSPIFKNISILVSGTGIAQGIGFLLYFFISQLYSPAEFGSYSIIITWASLLAMAATLRYDLAIMIPPDTEKASRLYKLALFCIVITAGLIFLVISASCIFHLFTNQSFNYGYFLIPVLVFFIAFNQTGNVYLNRSKQYKIIASSRIVTSLTNGVSSILLSFMHNGYMSLVSAFLLSVLASISFTFNKLKHLLENIKSIFNISSNKALMIEYKQFPLYNVPQSLIDALQFNIIIFIADYLYNKDTVGQISFALKILQVPLSFVGAAISQVFMQQMSERLQNNVSIHRLTQKITLLSIVIFIPVWLLFLFYGQTIFIFFFGLKWADAGLITSILITWFFADFVRSPLSQLAVMYNQQKTLLIFSFISNVIIVSSMFLGYKYFGSVFKMLTLSGIAAVVPTVFLIVWLMRLAKKESFVAYE